MVKKSEEKMEVDLPKVPESKEDSNTGSDKPDSENSETKTNEGNLSKRAKLKEKKRLRALELEKPEHKIPRGLAKSGRIWKTKKEQFRKVKKSLPKFSTEKQLKIREEMRHIKELSKSIKEERKHENELKKQRREENAKRRLENERKSEIVQIIKNPAKIKRMKKKQLRSIEKRDISKVKVV